MSYTCFNITFMAIFIMIIYVFNKEKNSKIKLAFKSCCSSTTYYYHVVIDVEENI